MITLILLALAAVAVAVIVIAILNWEKIIDWFKGRQSLKQSDKDNIAFTIKDEMAKGKVPVVQGIFNTRTEKVEDAVKYESKELDEKVAEKHRNSKLVLYE